jgi:hypothetical protein
MTDLFSIRGMAAGALHDYLYFEVRLKAAAWKGKMAKTETGDRFVESMLAGLSAAGIKRQIRAEYRAGYPNATAAQLKMLYAAEIKAGYPPLNLAHAKLILSDNLLAFRPAHGSPFDKAGIYWRAFHHWKPSGQQPRGL